VPHKAFGLAGHSEEASSWLKRGEGQTHKKRYSRTFVISSLFELDVILVLVEKGRYSSREYICN